MLSLEQILEDPAACANADTVKWLAEQLHLERSNMSSTLRIELRAIEGTVHLTRAAVQILNRVLGVNLFPQLYSQTYDCGPVVFACRLNSESCDINDDLQNVIGRIIAECYSLPTQPDYLIFNVIGQLVQMDKSWQSCYDLLQRMSGVDEDIADNISYSLFNILDIITHFPGCNVDVVLVKVTSANHNSEMCMFYSKHFASWTSLSNQLAIFASLSDSIRRGNIDEFVATLASVINDYVAGVNNFETCEQIKHRLVDFLSVQNELN